MLRVNQQACGLAFDVWVCRYIDPSSILLLFSYCMLFSKIIESRSAISMCVHMAYTGHTNNMKSILYYEANIGQTFTVYDTNATFRFLLGSISFRMPMQNVEA